MRKRVLILAAGGGHTGYGYALAQALHTRAHLSFLVPKGDLLSERRLSAFGNVKSLIMGRGPKTPAHEFAVRLARAFVDTMGLHLQDFDVVVSTGSNFCVPPALIAWIIGVPVVNIESPVRFVKPSKAVRVLQPFSAITALPWEEQTRLLKGVVVGPILSKPEYKPKNKGYILVAGGTYGHRPLFDTLAHGNLHNVVLQTGKIDPAPYLREHPEWKAITVTEEFHELLAGAELVVTHLGVTVLEAVLIYKKPVVLVPNPEWTRTGTPEDAKYLARKLNAVLVSEMETEILLDAIGEARKRKVPTIPNGAKKLADLVMNLSRRG